MLLKIALLLSMLIQLGAAIIAISLIRRTRYNSSWILISIGFALMAVRRLFEFSTYFWESRLFPKEDIHSWLGIFISVLLFVGVIYIREIFNLQDRIEQIRKESESRVLSAVIQAEEKARQMFARDLHDGLGPVLSSIKMSMSAIDAKKLDLQNREIIERSAYATDEAIVSLKEISNQLSPHLLQNYGLSRAVETFSSQLLNHSTIQFEMESNMKNERFSYDLEISLYRIISELMNNSIKHGQPKQITLSLMKSTESINLRYSDDGRGFNATNFIEGKSFKGMGLENIRSRVKSLKGLFSLDSSLGEGVNIFIYIPLP